MFSLTHRRLFLFNQFADLRKSFDTLAALVKNQMNLDSLSGDAFIFINKRKNRLKILIWEDSGFWILSKRLEIGTFYFSPNSEKNSILLSDLELQMLLKGVILIQSRQLKRYKKN